MFVHLKSKFINYPNNTLANPSYPRFRRPHQSWVQQMQDWPVRVAKHGVRVVHDYLCGNAATDQWDIYNAVITTPNPVGLLFLSFARSFSVLLYLFDSLSLLFSLCRSEVWFPRACLRFRFGRMLLI